jgi:hypothetical protein
MSCGRDKDQTKYFSALYTILGPTILPGFHSNNNNTLSRQVAMEEEDFIYYI